MLSLKAKELTHLAIGHFRVVQSIGEGGFGTVFEVVKRDCGVRYAMKSMKKKKLEEIMGDDWDSLVLNERQVLSAVHHPLLINIAYAFQNVHYLLLVMDLCPGGDLSAFGVGGDADSLSVTQVRFVGLEVVAVIAHLHKCQVMFRDLKPANLLLANDGHVRLIDFGIAKKSDGPVCEPTSTAECGSRPYMAPEVASCFDTGKAYGAACDWFALGTMLYEFTERDYPYGDEPRFKNVEKEFVVPQLRTEDGRDEIPHMFDLLCGLLDWSPSTRLCGNELREHPYWKDENGYTADWEIVDKGLLPSPLMHIAEERMERALKKAAASAGNWRRDEATLKLAKELSAAAAQQAQVDALNEEGDETDEVEGAATRFGARSKSILATHQTTEALQALADLESDMRVDNWEFNSPHAISREYMESHQDVVSVL